MIKSTHEEKKLATLKVGDRSHRPSRTQKTISSEETASLTQQDTEILYQSEDLRVYQIRHGSSEDNSQDQRTTKSRFLIAAIFLCTKVNLEVVKDLHKLLQKYNREARGLYLDISNIDSVAMDVLRYNIDMITDLSKSSDTAITKVAITCPGSITKKFFDMLMKCKPPPVETKAFQTEEEGLKFVLSCLT